MGPLLLLVASCVSAVRGWPEDDGQGDVPVPMPPPLHVAVEGNLLVLTPAGLAQTLNQTRFLMVLFRECPRLPRGGVGAARPPCCRGPQDFRPRRTTPEPPLGTFPTEGAWIASPAPGWAR